MDTVVQAFPITPRSGVIIALGIFSILICGPLTGIPGWMMANQDLRDLKAGLITTNERSRLQTGKILNIVGTFLSPLWAILYIVLAFVLMSMVIVMLAVLC